MASDPIGNHVFSAYVEDWNEPGGGLDHFWFQVFDKKRFVIETFFLLEPAPENAVELSGGNIFAPHGGGGEQQPKKEAIRNRKDSAYTYR